MLLAFRVKLHLNALNLLNLICCLSDKPDRPATVKRKCCFSTVRWIIVFASRSMVCFIYLLKVKCGPDYLFVLLVNCYFYNYHTKYLMMKPFFNETLNISNCVSIIFKIFTFFNAANSHRYTVKCLPLMVIVVTTWVFLKCV